MQHVITVKGRSLIRTYLASATKNAAICLVSEEQAQKKKMSLDLVHSKRMIAFASDDGPLIWLVAQRRVFIESNL